MLVNSKQMLDNAVAGHYAVGAFNTNDLEWCHAIMLAAEETQSPLIIQCSMGAGKYQTGYKTVSALVHAMYDALNLTVPVSLHLDHGSYDACLECIDAGFTSVMYDGSHEENFDINMKNTAELVRICHSKGISIEAEVGLECIDAGFTSVMYDGSHEENFDINMKNTAELVRICHSKGISIEAEVGSIGGTEDGITGTGECADPAECKAIADLGVDMLAAGIGNIHGLYPENWTGLQFDVLKAIKAEVGDMPLVLHGGTGIPADQIARAIDLGVAKINVNTELQVVWADAVEAEVGDMPLVLHGGTGIPADQIARAIDLGVAKINVNTELQVVWADAVAKYVRDGGVEKEKGFDPRKMLKPGTAAIQAKTEEKIREFGSAGKGWN